MAFEKNKFADGWKIIKFRDCIIQLNTGLNPRDNFSLGKGNIKYITAKNLSQSGTIDFSTCDYIDQKAKYIIHKRSDIQKGDILFASRAPIGHSYLIKEEPVDFDIGESIFCIRVNNDVVLPEYLCLYLSSAFFIKMASKRVTGSVIQEIRIGDLLDTDVIIPPRKTQQNISLHIDAIDRKIALNKSICSDLESMAKLLYDYWFVQFDFPDENGRPYKSSGGKMVWNEELKREIPEGWEVKRVCDIASLQQNSIFPVSGRQYSHYSIPAYDEVKMPALEDGDAIASNKYLVTEKSVLVSKLNPQFKRIWLILHAQENAICSTEFLPVKATEASVYYLYSLLNSDAFSVHLKQKASSSTGSRKRIDPENVMSFRFAYNEKIARLLNEKTASIIEQANRMPVENQQLASLRDFLLPMLMNGQVKVGKAGD